MHGERGHFFNSFKVSPSPIKVAVELGFSKEF